ncbi:hypothetical protein PVAND_000590 [Polypedilum vanderplanki]|uniref:Protein FRA10AC1-like protein n=1 Tax=Polypedilum vanderplanki TaxID=319348 RepID=A0A9J6BKM4_POLVA|nr:hypothetical protein PVAND_000590 [Polypedilum vanderplanki]
MARHSHLNPYDYHKYLINQYVLKRPGDTRFLHGSETKKIEYKSDRDIALENLRFIWNEEDKPKSWEEKLAKKYYDKLFREYCICDLTRYKENKIANRFRVEKEVINGKGQFTCGEKACSTTENLKTWEVNFSYIENQEKKNALVKIRLCETCSEKLNYHSKKREIKRLKRKRRKSPSLLSPQPSSSSSTRSRSSSQVADDTKEEKEITENINIDQKEKSPEAIWKDNTNQSEVREREDDFDEYLADLLM